MNFSKAADACCVVQSTISHRIADLEEELGTRLFDRDRRRVQLTPAGNLFLVEARGIVTKADRAQERIRELNEHKSQTLRIGYHATGIGSRFGSLLREFSQENHVEIKLMNSGYWRGNLLEHLENDEVDLAITLAEEPETVSPIRYIPIFDTAMRLVVGKEHWLTGRNTPVTREELGQLRERISIVTPLDDENVLQQGTFWLRNTLHLDERRVGFSRNLLELQMEIEAGLAVGLMMETELSCLNRENGITALEMEGLPPMSICVAVHKDRCPPLVETFIDKLISMYAEMK